MRLVQLTPAQRSRLRAALRNTADAAAYRRLLAILELDGGQSVATVADQLGVTRQSVYNWADTFAQSPGVRVLRDHYGGGRPGLWDEPLRALLTACLRQRPDELGYAAVNWTVPLLQEHLERHGGCRLSDDTIRRELQRRGYVWKRYRYVLPPDPQREKKTRHPAAAAGLAAGQCAAGR
jgi:transposase